MSSVKQEMVPACFMVPAEAFAVISEIVAKLGGKATMGYAPGVDDWVPVERLPEKIRPGRMLRAARLREDITQAELAKAVGIPQSHVSQMENGKRSISSEKARAFAQVLNTVPSDFLTENQ